MLLVKMRAKVVEDNTGVGVEIPVLISEQGPILSLVDYLLSLKREGASNSLLDKTIRAVTLFVRYIDANISAFDNPKSMFDSFAHRLYSGTMGEDCVDPSNLYWIPASIKTSNYILYNLTKYMDWVVENKNGIQLNNLRKATSHEQRLNYAAWFRKTHGDFLGHIKDKSIGDTAKLVRRIRGRKPLLKVDDDAISFPNPIFERFFIEGIGGAPDPRVALRDKLILLLMHGAGLRLSEAISIWVHDVLEDPSDPSKAIVHLYNEHEGIAPNGWKSSTGSNKRPAYLLEKFGRKSRYDMLDKEKLGWKSKIVDHNDKYLIAHWFPVEFSKIFMLLYKSYIKFRAAIECNHPYAFISFHKKHAGSVYTINAFNQNYNAALRRIDLQQNKKEGLSPHGHRHNYGRRLKDAGIHPAIIKKCLHHARLESQLVYTTSSSQQVSELMTQASQELERHSNSRNLEWKTLVVRGFEDIDPHGLFTGTYPLLRK